MTKEEAVELVQDHLVGGDVTPDGIGKYHPAVIEKIVEIIYEDLMEMAYRQAKKYSDFSQLDSFSTVYPEVDVKYDGVRKKYYSDLPVPIVQLPDNTQIRLISPAEDESQAYVYRESSGGSFVMSGLEVDYVMEEPIYIQEKDRVYYINMTKRAKPDSLLMKLIPKFSVLEDEDEFYIPNLQNVNIIQMAESILERKRVIPEDVPNDNIVN